MRCKKDVKKDVKIYKNNNNTRKKKQNKPTSVQVLSPSSSFYDWKDN